MNTMKKGALVLLACIVPLFANAQKYTPVTRVTKGDVYTYRMETQVESVQSVGEQEMNVTASTKVTIKDSVCNVLDNGNTEIIASFWDLSASTKAMGMDTVLTMEGMTGSPVKITFSTSGKVIERVVMDESQQDISQLDMTNSTLQETLFLPFPETSLSTGDTWTVESLDTMNQASLGGQINVSSVTEYTLGEKETIEEKDIYKVTYVTNLELTGEGNMQGMTVALEGAGVNSGTVSVDASSGVIIASISETEMDMTIALTGPQNMIIPMTQKVNVTFKLLE